MFIEGEYIYNIYIYIYIEFIHNASEYLYHTSPAYAS